MMAPFLVAEDGWGAVLDVPGCVGRGLGFPSGPAMTHRPASGTPAPYTAAIWLPEPVRLGRVGWTKQRHLHPRGRGFRKLRR